MKSTLQIDPELLEACKRKERLAQNELYKQLFSYLMNICIRYKNDYDTAGASLNNIYLKILNKLESYQSDKSFQAWIKRIAINQLIDEYRKHQRENENLSFLEDHSQNNNLNYSSPHQGEQKLDSDYLRQMIAELPPITAKVFNLYAIDGFKHKEIAELLCMSENTSKWHLRDARIKLQERLVEFENLSIS